MPMSRELKCIFVHVPRTGGTSIENAFGMFRDVRKEDKETLFGSVKSPELIASSFTTDVLQHLTAAEIRGLLGDTFKDYFRFAFVRNPWERTVSIYAYYRKLTGDTLSFTEFVEYTDGHLRNPNNLPQYKFIFDEKGDCLVDFVGRFENLLNDFAEVCARLKVERELPHFLPATIGDWRSYYDEFTRRIVEQRCGEDIERFGYSF